MTEKERFDLCMSTKLGEILTEEFKTYLLANGFFSAPASTKYHGAYVGAVVEEDEWRDYTNAIHRYANVLWTHHADMLASHVVGI